MLFWDIRPAYALCVNPQKPLQAQAMFRRIYQPPEGIDLFSSYRITVKEEAWSGEYLHQHGHEH